VASILPNRMGNDSLRRWVATWSNIGTNVLQWEHLYVEDEKWMMNETIWMMRNSTCIWVNECRAYVGRTILKSHDSWMRWRFFCNYSAGKFFYLCCMTAAFCRRWFITHTRTHLPWSIPNEKPPMLFDELCKVFVRQNFQRMCGNMGIRNIE
jgi:hypothetical protein